MITLLALAAAATLSVQVRVESPIDPREVELVTATCQRVGHGREVCTITDGLTWVEVLECETRQCVTIEYWEQW